MGGGGITEVSVGLEKTLLQPAILIVKNVYTNIGKQDEELD